MSLAALDGAVLSALADDTRRRVLDELAARPGGASGLADRLPITRQAIAKHLGVLESAGLVRPSRSGREIVYEVEADRLIAAGRALEDAAARWQTQLAALKRAAEAAE